MSSGDAEPFEYVPAWLPDADDAFEDLLAGLPWEQRALRIYGREVLTPRLTCWVGPEPYRYAGGEEPAHAWTPVLAGVRDALARRVGAPFSCVLANLYRSGGDSMGVHKDDERELGPEPVIASVNLGEARDFVAKHDVTGERRVWRLGHGDLLVMRGESQRAWTHSVPRRAGAMGARINLTFRVWKPPGWDSGR